MHATVLRLSDESVYIFIGVLDLSNDKYMTSDPYLAGHSISNIIETVESSDNDLEDRLMLKYTKICGTYSVHSTTYQKNIQGSYRIFIKNRLRHESRQSNTSGQICLVLRDGEIVRNIPDVMKLFPDIAKMPRMENLKYALPTYFLDISMSKFKMLMDALKWRHNYNPFLPIVRKYVEKFTPDIRYSFTLQQSMAICISSDNENHCWYISDNNQNIYDDNYRDYSIGGINFSTSDGLSYVAYDEKNVHGGTIEELYSILSANANHDTLLYNGEIYCIIAKL